MPIETDRVLRREVWNVLRSERATVRIWGNVSAGVKRCRPGGISQAIIRFAVFIQPSLRARNHARVSMCVCVCMCVQMCGCVRAHAYARARYHPGSRPTYDIELQKGRALRKMFPSLTIYLRTSQRIRTRASVSPSLV